MFKRLLVLGTILGGLFVTTLAPLPGSVAHATDVLQGACSGPGSGSAVCRGKSTQDPLTGPNGVLTTVTNILAWVAGTAAVIFVVVGGIKYITAAGAPAEVQKAKETIIFALVGVVLIVLARAIITFVLSRV